MIYFLAYKIICLNISCVLKNVVLILYLHLHCQVECFSRIMLRNFVVIPASYSMIMCFTFPQVYLKSHFIGEIQD